MGDPHVKGARMLVPGRSGAVSYGIRGSKCEVICERLEVISAKGIAAKDDADYARLHAAVPAATLRTWRRSNAIS